jgi:uncharacterized protein
MRKISRDTFKKVVMTEREQEVFESVKNVLVQHLRPEKIFLFGSRAKTKQSSRSDFDFAVSGKRPALETVRLVNEEIEKVCGLYKTDLVFLDEVDPEFKQIILDSGEVVYERK